MKEYKMGAKKHPQNNKHTIKTIKIINETSPAQNHWNVSWISTSCGLNCEICRIKVFTNHFSFLPNVGPNCHKIKTFLWNIFTLTCCNAWLVVSTNLANYVGKRKIMETSTRGKPHRLVRWMGSRKTDKVFDLMCTSTSIFKIVRVLLFKKENLTI